MSFISSDIAFAEKALTAGELVAIPTETVYGMAGNGFNESAVKQIFKVKNRPFYDPLILHTNSIEKLESWGLKIPEVLQPLAKAFWPGPLTLLIKKSAQVPEIITSGLDRVAVRIPSHATTLDLLSRLPFPLAAPSANPFGYVSPTTPEHVAVHFEGKIAMVLDGGPCNVGIESTIVGIENGKPTVYRLGGLSIERIESVVGKVQVNTSSSKPSAPGMLSKHYSPNKEIVTVDSITELRKIETRKTAFILFDLKKDVPPAKLIQLSLTSDHDEAAQKFYDALRHWDNDESITRLVIERLPDFGLGRAINDRLLRAAAK
ncbi:MAG: L-threonylcarbamoyladenylate synthase [Salibacteraceae bacterium]|nr:L-threonylcarbamoyladenylate synthase [Salibacteraceae bacterium]